MFHVAHDNHNTKSPAQKMKSFQRQVVVKGRSTPFSRQVKRSSSSEPSSRISLELMSDAIEEALGVVCPDEEGLSSSTTLDPRPIHPRGVQINDGNQLSSTWDSNDPNTDLVKWLFATPGQTSNTNEEPEPQVDSTYKSSEALENYEPIAAFSSSGFAESYDSDRTTIAPLNDALLKPEKWEERFHDFVEFQKEFETSLVPHNWPRNRELAQWVKRQRYQFKLKCKGLHSTLTDERLKALEDVGFIWSSHHALWEEKLQELKQFKMQHGHCNVPSRYPDNRQLSIWVRSQRRQYKLLSQVGTGGGNKSHMTKDRFLKLKSLGFEFNPRQLKC